MTGAPLVTRTVQSQPDTWLGHHSARVVCRAHADVSQLDWEPITEAEIFDFEWDLGQRLATIADCVNRHDLGAY